MVAEIITLVLTAAVLIVAVISLREQRRASTKQSNQLDHVRNDLVSVSKRIGRVERELEPWEHLVPRVIDMQGNHQHFCVTVHNPSTDETEVLEFVFEYNGKELSERAKPQAGARWRLAPGSSLPIRHIFNQSPVATLQYKEASQSFRQFDIDVVLVSRINDMERTARQRIWVTIAAGSSMMRHLR